MRLLRRLFADLFVRFPMGLLAGARTVARQFTPDTVDSQFTPDTLLVAVARQLTPDTLLVP